MERSTTKMLRIGAWCVNPNSGEISRDGEIVRLEMRTMRLLVCLADRAGDVVSIDELLDHVWSGVTVSPDSVYQAVASLRRLLGDDPRQPTYIATVPRQGYRMVAPVSPWQDPPVTPTPAPASTEVLAPALRRLNGVALGAGIVCAALLLALLVRGWIAPDRSALAITAATPKSVAVLPFLDLTSEKMTEEYFADGMTEELIDKLSKVPGYRVPGATSSFYFKGKKIAVADIAKALDVTYVLDGSVRRSGARLRVAARLIRADNGFVVWSDAYDRQGDDVLTVQDEIADEVVKALRASIDGFVSRVEQSTTSRGA